MEKGKIKTRLHLHDTVLFRIPQFPLNAKLEDCWEALKASIADASPDFYEMIRDLKPSDIPNQSSGVQITIGKYFNRARFRATPYGSFAGFGVCGLTQNDQQPMVIHQEPISHHFRNWPEIADLNDFWKNKPDHEIIVFANSSYYRIGDQIRYLYKEGREFELSDVGYEQVIEYILELCPSPIKLTELITALQPHCLDTDSIRPLIFDLIDAQLLLTNFHPNITGKDYFKRLNIPIDLKLTRYTITEYQTQSGGLNQAALKQIPELINFLYQWIPKQQKTTALENFISRFSKKYDYRRIPIMQAIDPEIGIGYGQFEAPQGLSELIKGMLAKKSKSETENQLKQTLTAKMLEQKATKVIHLETEIPDTNQTVLPLPNGINALLSITDEGILMEQLGGSTATSLTGRFSIGSEQVLAACRELASKEQQANPDVLFFEIAHTGDPSADNINRREQIYPLQLSILNYDTSNEPLSLNDIDLAVIENQLYLISRKHNKRLIPRLSTAYNYTRSDLSLFRLLCDLQMQDIQTRLIPDLEQLIPGQKFYPRIQYKQIILGTAKWQLEYQDKFQSQDEFLNYLKDLELPEYVKVGHADQTLMLHLSDTFDLQILLSILKARKTLWANEALTQSKYQVKDQQGNNYASEFLVSYVHDQNIYKGISITDPIKENTVQRTFLPGSEWLYFEFYCHPIQSDELLRIQITELLLNFEAEISEWFFIRYNDNGDHIRLRLSIPDQNHLSKILKAVEIAMQSQIDSGLISDIRICCYQREIEKYTPKLYPVVESHFHADSCYALSCIQHGLDEATIYYLSLILMEEIGKSVFHDTNEFQNLLKGLCEAHNREHEMNPKLFKMLNSNYNDFRKENLVVPDYLIQHYKSLRQSFVNMLTMTTEERKPDLFANLFHMHINRLFASDQRIHETIIYNYLVKQIKTAQHHQKELV